MSVVISFYRLLCLVPNVTIIEQSAIFDLVQHFPTCRALGGSEMARNVIVLLRRARPRLLFTFQLRVTSKLSFFGKLLAHYGGSLQLALPVCHYADATWSR